MGYYSQGVCSTLGPHRPVHASIITWLHNLKKTEDKDHYLWALVALIQSISHIKIRGKLSKCTYTRRNNLIQLGY
jgi:hypothetical protein